MRLLRYRRSLRKILFLIILITVIVHLIYYFTFLQADTVSANIIISSVTYFQNSKIYSDNTAVVLLISHYNLPPKDTFKCVSQNSKGEFKTSYAIPKSAYTPVGPCKLHTFLAACSTVSNPKNFYVSAKSSSKELVNVPFRNAISERLPVVSCVSSLFYAERWQTVAMSIEWYAYFGVSRQAYYILSAMKGIHELLKAYDKARLIDLHYWNVPNIPELDSRKQLSTRDLAGSLNDCFLLYREAADFIMVHDVDDLIYFKQGSQFLPPLKQLWQDFPLTRSLNFSARTVEMEAEKGFAKFSMQNSFNSMNVLPDAITGKSIYNTSLIESVWIHWTTEYDHRLTPVTWDERDAVLIHARNFNFGKYNNSSNRNILQESILSPEHAKQINQNFENRKSFFEGNPSIQEMESSMRYYSNIDECTLAIGGYDAKIFGCRTHYACKIPRFLGVKCIESRQNYVKHLLTPSLTFYVSQKQSPTPTLNKNGCSL